MTRIVLDLDDADIEQLNGSRDQLENLLVEKGCVRGGSLGVQVLTKVTTQIEAQIPKPKPEEPIGLGAVVEDARGHRWTRTFPEPTKPMQRHWFWAVDAGHYARWDELDVVRVLSEGVQP